MSPESLEVQPLEAQQSDESKPLISEVDEIKHQTNNAKIPEADNKLVDGSDKDDSSPPSCEANVASPEELERASLPLHTSKEVNQSEELTLPEPSHSESSKPEMEKTISEKDTKSSVSKSEESDHLDKTDDTACEASSACAHIGTTLKATENSLVLKVEPEQKLTKSDKQIIEKIRSYYEAAEAGVEEGQMARRNSFSNIPAGLVKDSVSRFNVCVHQDSLVESESGHSDSVETDSGSSLLPILDQADQTFNLQESADIVIPLSHSDVTQEQKEKLASKTAEKHDVEICEFSPCLKLWKDKERIGEESQNNPKAPLSRENSCVEHTDIPEKNKTSINCTTTLVQQKLSERSQCNSDSSDPSNLQMTETADASLQYGRRTRARMSSNGSLDSLPSQIKVGRWSRHDKVVTCSHTLYEGMAEVPDLEFLEGGPVNQCLVENSEKILNKVQMLARMYTAKASSMKVPLHQKKTRVSRGTWSVEGKGSTSPKSQQVQLHQGDMRILSQPTGELLT